MTVTANILISAIALSVACSLLSLFVVLCRWAFIGEGIGHSGFGGAGTAWLLILLFPQLDLPWVPDASVVIFCLLTGVAIAAISRRGGIHADAVIGIFMVASLAWGFLAQQVFLHVKHTSPALFENLLFGQLAAISPAQMGAAIVISVGVLTIVILLWKEILAYSYDPLLASSSGVPVGLIHYLLVVLLSLVIIVAMRLAGSVLVTALLVLPGATALRLSRRLNGVIAISITVGLVGAISGVLLNHHWTFIPPGPLMVLVLFLQFLIAWGMSALRPPIRFDLNSLGGNPVDEMRTT